MMNLDLATLYVFAGFTISAVTAMFLLDVTRRGATPVDRIWTLALGSALATSIAYAGAATAPGLWWLVGLGNAACALTTFSLWSGIRGFGGRRPLLGLGVGVASLCALVTLVQGAEAGEWAGGGVMLAATGTGALLAAGAVVRGPMHHVSAGPPLLAILTVVWLFYLLRLVLYVSRGPYSPEFTTYAGTELTTLILTLLVLTAAFAMVSARAEHVQEQWRERHGFDPVTGARTPAAFRRRATELLEQAQRSGLPAAVVTVVLEDAAELMTGFGREHAEQAVVTVGQLCVESAPAGSVVGRPGPEADSFEVLVLGLLPTEVVGWADDLRKHVIDSPLAVPGSTVRLRVSVGVATDTDGAADLAELCDTAWKRAKVVLATGGNRVGHH